MVLLFSQNLFAQENINEITDIKTPGTDLNILEKNSIWSRFPYKLTNGTELSYDETILIVKSLKVNETLLKEEWKYQIASKVFHSILGFSLLGWITFTNNEQRMNNNLYLLIATVGLGTSFFVTKGIAEKKLDKAVHNYNLYVMGIQIQNN